MASSLEQMSSNRPYLIRAIYEWITDNQFTPQLLVDTSIANVMVPQQFIKDKQILLNVSHLAVTALTLGNESITFSARFSGKAFNINIPIEAVLAIFSRENSQGMAFPDENPNSDAENRDAENTLNVVASSNKALKKGLKNSLGKGNKKQLAPVAVKAGKTTKKQHKAKSTASLKVIK